MDESNERELPAKPAYDAAGKGAVAGARDYALADGVIAPADAVPAQVRSKKYTLSVLFYSLQPLMLSALMFPATVYVIHTLGPLEYGQWVTATTLVATTVFLNNLGLRGPFVRFVAQHPEDGAKALAEQLGLRMALSCVAGAAALAAAYFLGYGPIILLCTLLAVVQMFLVTIAATACDLLQALERFTTVSITTIISGVILTTAALIVAWRGGGPAAIAAAYLTGPAVVAPLLLWIIHKHHYRVGFRLNWGRAKELLWKARYFGAQQLLGTASVNVTPLVVSRFLGSIGLGYFSAGSLLAERLTAIPDGMGGAVYPAVAKAAKKDSTAVLHTTGYYLALSLLVCIPATLVGTFFANQIAWLFFPKTWEIAAPVIRVTMWILPLMAVEYVFSNSLNALHKDAQQAWASLWGISHLVVAFLLIWKFGMVGACWAMVLRPVVRLTMIMPCIVQTYRPMWREHRASVKQRASSRVHVKTAEM